MTASLRDLFDLISPDFSDEILSTDSKKKISGFLRKIPFSITHQIYLEIPLTEPTHSADLAFVCSTPYETRILRELLAHRTALFTTDERALAQLGRLSSKSFEGLQTFWFEYDLSTACGDIPSVFIDSGSLSSRSSGQELLGLLHSLAALREHPLTAAEGSFFDECLRRLPPEESIRWIGLMLSRNTSALRLTTSHMTLKQACGYLDSLDWKGDKGLLAEIPSHLPEFPTTALSFDVSDHVHARLGMEFKLKDRDIPRLRDKWDGFLSFLCKNSLCSPDLKQALIRLIQFKFELRSTPDQPVFYYSTINHVKLISDNGALSAKAYIYVGRLPSRNHYDRQTFNSFRGAALCL